MDSGRNESPCGDVCVCVCFKGSALSFFPVVLKKKGELLDKALLDRWLITKRPGREGYLFLPLPFPDRWMDFKNCKTSANGWAGSCPPPRKCPIETLVHSFIICTARYLCMEEEILKMVAPRH